MKFRFTLISFLVLGIFSLSSQSIAADTYDALMKNDGRHISLDNFVDCMDPSPSRSCPHVFHKKVTWEHYAGVINGRFSAGIRTYEEFKTFMLSDRVTVIPCTKELIGQYKMARVNLRTGEISIDYFRDHCYQPKGGVEQFFAVDGEPVISDICANGMELRVQKETFTPVCLPCAKKKT